MIYERIEIWDGKAYEGIEKDNKSPYMDAYILDGERKRPCVLILPGGGYVGHSPREAEPIALKFAQQGYHASVLYYSVFPNKHPQPLLDVSLALSIIREKSSEWNINKDKIFVCGFSAGGHLAASLGVHWNKDYISSVLNIKKGSNKPNALILCYPVIVNGEKMHKGSFENLLGENASEDLLNEMSLEKQIGKQTPPTFLWHTFEDTSVPVDNSLMFAESLNNNNIPFEMHIYPNGAHGLSLAQKITADNKGQINAHAASWMDLCLDWMDSLY